MAPLPSQSFLPPLRSSFSPCSSSRLPPLPLLFLLLVALLFCHGALAQQAYPKNDYTLDCTKNHSENAGYVCSDPKQECQTLAYYIVQSGRYGTLDAIATSLFGTTAAKVAAANNFSATHKVNPGDALLIPLDCKCNGNLSQMDFNFTIQPGDTFANLANNTYEGLTTCQAMQNANPGVVVTDLQIGEKYVFPIRCACPSQNQSNGNVKLLLTYPVQTGDTASSIWNLFGVASQDFLSANNLTVQNPSLFAATTVLVPLKVTPLEAPTISKAPAVSSPPPSVAVTPPSHKKSKVGLYAGIAAAVVVALLLLAAAGYWMARRRRRATKREALVPATPQYKAVLPEKNTNKLQEDLLAGMSGITGSEKLQVYTMDELKEATDDFVPSSHIKGAVYRGVLNGRVVAIKKMTRNVSLELQILQKVHHTNLVKLLGVCISGPEHPYLVYEYAENGSLSDWLHEQHNVVNSSSFGSSTFLSWNSRLQIALDVATALQYIHDHTSPSFVHKDIKTSNILLDSNFRGKIANFGLAKSTEEMQQGAALTRHIVGTQGYMAPEYVSHGLVTPKLDVFAYGVVLLEMISGEEAIIRDEERGDPVLGPGSFLYESVRPLLERDDAKERLGDWIDPVLQNNNAYPLDCAFSLAMLAKSCVEQEPSSRPIMRDVAFILAKLLETSLEWESSGVQEQNYSENPLEAR